MRITGIRVPGRAGQALCINGLGPGLSVIYGPNGSGKTTLLDALRAILCGFDERALRRWRTTGGPCGPAISTHWRGAEYRVVRVPRTGHPDTLALRFQHGDVAAAAELRRELTAAVPVAVAAAHFVRGAEWHAVDALLSAAESDGITVRADTRRDGSWLGSSLRPAAVERLTALTGSAGEEHVAKLRQRCIDLRDQLAGEQEVTERHCDEAAEELACLDRQIERMCGEAASLDADLQAITTDLRESEERGRANSGNDPAQPGSAGASTTSGSALSPQIENVRRVLRDLADARRQLSLELVAVGCDSRPTADAAANRLRFLAERAALDRCEHELHEQLSRLRRAAADTSLPRAGDERGPRETIIDHGPRVLQARWSELSSQLDKARSDLIQLRARRAAAHDGLRAFCCARTLEAAQFDLDVAEQELAGALTARESAGVVLQSIDRLREQLAESAEPRVLRAASAHLAYLGGANCSMTSHDAGGELLVLHEDGSACRWGDLSRGTLDAVSLALRLALFAEFHRRGRSAPLVLDEVLADADAERLRRAVALLAQQAQDGRQIVVLTCRAQLAAWLVQHGAQLHRLDDAGSPLPELTGPVLSTAEAAGSAATPESAGSDRMIRVHPAHRLWLRSDAALSHLPSLGPQMVGRLGVLGVRTVGDLIHLDPESATAVLQRLHVSTTQLRLWQAEARLLCCVPDLTGRDAQLLVLCGILGEQELAAASVDHVVERMERLQGVRSEGWLPSRGAWPTRETVQRWIRAAGAAREIPPRESALLPFSAEGTDDPAESPSASEFCLHVDRPVVDAPSIGPTTARRLERIGIQTVAQLLSCDPDGTAGRLRRSRISAEMIRAWQRQARLMCCVPGLRGHDAQVLVACGITEAADLRRISPSALYAMVRPFLETDEGRRALRSARTPDLAEVTAWVEAAQRTRALRAA